MIPTGPGKAIPSDSQERRVNVFAYGSLMYGPVWSRVVSGDYRSLRGTVRGFARLRIAGEVYPALVRAAPKSAVDGVLYLEVAEGDVAALDRFEGAQYARIPVTVVTEDGSTVDGWTYLFLDESRLEHAGWEPARFEGTDLRHFLDTYCRERGVS